MNETDDLVRTFNQGDTVYISRFPKDARHDLAFHWVLRRETSTADHLPINARYEHLKPQGGSNLSGNVVLWKLDRNGIVRDVRDEDGALAEAILVE
ncbi:hypothetical protein MD484_g6189, partial [Candolleomyces efflorescens]